MQLRENQLPPEGDWKIWLILAGRGWGKSLAITQWAMAQAKALPGSKGAIVAQTIDDAVDVLIEGVAGILENATPDFTPEYFPSRRKLVFPNGSTAHIFSSNDPNRLRIPQRHWAICDELTSWENPETFDNLMFGLRLGGNPLCTVGTTPRPVPIIKRLLNDPSVAVTRGSTYENKNLSDEFIRTIEGRDKDDSIGKQEIDGEMPDDDNLRA